jgi:homocysteine S-methyltransferase
MGTMLYGKGIFLNRCFDELNETQPDLVAEVHREYVRAGADIIETNTFGANRFKLANFGLADRTRALNTQGARIARHAARDRVFVAGAIGPLGVRIEPWGRTSVGEAEDAFREQATALAEGGVDLFMLETFRDLNELVAAVKAVRSVSPLPIVAQMTTDVDGNSLDGTPPSTFAPALERAGADVIGVNCSVGPAAMLETVEAIARVSSARLAAQPNAGRPRDVEGRNLYLCSPTTWRRTPAGSSRPAPASSADAAGPRPTISARSPRPCARWRRRPRGRREPWRRPGIRRGRGRDRREKSGLGRALADGEFAIVIEAAAPRGLDLTSVLEQATRYRDAGAVAVNVPDYPKSGARASALASRCCSNSTASRRCCITPVAIEICSACSPTWSARTRWGCGIFSSRPAIRRRSRRSPTRPRCSMSMRSVSPTWWRASITGSTSAGRRSASRRSFTWASPSIHSRRISRRVAAPDAQGRAGAEYLVTPPIFDIEAFGPLLERLRGTGLPILAGLAVIDGLRHAEFLASEVVGVKIPRPFSSASARRRTKPARHWR